MKRTTLTSEWLGNWTPTKTTEVADAGCKGLLVRGGPAGVRTFYRWADARDDVTGTVRRKRVKLGHWPVLSLRDAQGLVHEAREARHVEGGGADLTVGGLAEAYRRDVLSQREPVSAAWSWGIIRTHVLSAKPAAKGPPFGEWPARTVRPPDIAAVIRAARVERTTEIVGSDGTRVSRRVGGSAVARATLREVKAIFNAAVGAGSLEMTPAGALQAKALGLKKVSRKRFLDADEMKALFQALEFNELLDGTAKPRKLSESVRLGIALLFYCPVRSHTLVAAEWSEIDLDAGRWVVPVTKLKLHQEQRAEARPFTMPLPPTAVAILRRLRALAGASPWVLATPRTPSDPKSPPRHLGSKVLIRALVRLQESGRLAAGSRFTVHDARRTWRSWAGDLGVPFEVAERHLAHVLPGVADIYAQGELIEQRTKAAELVGAAFDRIRVGKGARVTPIVAARN